MKDIYEQNNSKSCHQRLKKHMFNDYLSFCSEVAFRLSRMTMAMPHFPAFPAAAYPFAAGLGGGIYPPRGGGTGNGRGDNHATSGGRAGNGLNGWQWNMPHGGGPGAVNGGWAGDANWPQRGPVPWMAAGAEVWGHPRSGGNNYNWGGGVANGTTSGGSGTGRGSNRKR